MQTKRMLKVTHNVSVIYLIDPRDEYVIAVLFSDVDRSLIEPPCA